MIGCRFGWRLGRREVRPGHIRVLSRRSHNVSTGSRRAALVAFMRGPAHTEMMRDAFDKRRQAMHSVLASIDGLVCPEPEGAFYMFPDVSALIGRTFGGVEIGSSMQLAERALEDAGVAIVPGEPFGAPGHVRFSFALGDDDLARGIDRFAAFASA